MKTMETCIGVAARIWCDQDFRDMVMDGEACKEIANILYAVANPDPNVLPSGRRCACGNDPCTCGGDPIGAG